MEKEATGGSSEIKESVSNYIAKQIYKQQQEEEQQEQKHTNKISLF